MQTQIRLLLKEHLIIVNTVCHSTKCFVKQTQKKQILGKKTWNKVFRIVEHLPYWCNIFFFFSPEYKVLLFIWIISLSLIRKILRKTLELQYPEEKEMYIHEYLLQSSCVPIVTDSKCEPCEPCLFL